MKKKDHENADSSSVEMWRAKVGFCGNYFGLSAVGPFFSILLAAKGFSPSSVGLLASLNPLATLLIVPPVAYFCDKYQKNSTIVFIGSLASALLLLIITISVDQPTIAAATLCFCIVSTPVDPLLDQHTMAMLPPDRKNEWGSARVFGAYGWGVGAPLASQLITIVGWPVLAVQYAAGRAANVFCVLTGKVHSRPEPTGVKYFEVLSFVLGHHRMLLFLVCVCFMGMGYVFIATFLFLFLQSLGAPDLLLGLSISMTVLVEIPLFMHSSWIHQHFTDRQLFAASMIGWSARVTGYSFLTNPWVVLVLEPFHGFTFGCMWLAGVHYCQKTFPKSLSTSAFGFLHASAFGIGPFLGNIVGGQMYELMGPRWMFRASACVMLLILVLYLVLDHWLEAQEQLLLAADGGSASAPEAGVLKGLPESPRHLESGAELPEK